MQAQIPFVTTGSYPIRAGNTVQLLIDGEPAFLRVCQAIETAQHRVWATITFMWADFRMPDGRGTAFEVLDRAAKRGVDVRLLFWRPDEATAHHRRNAFWGAEEHFALLEQFNLGIRWDCAQAGFCQHQKTWLIDAGTDHPIAFLGGLNLNPNSVVAPRHYGQGQNHDLYIELIGAAVADVQHNFVQRWNEASERHFEHGYWGEGGKQNLEFPSRLPKKNGTALVQIQRTIHAGRYNNGHAPVAGQVFDIKIGEQTIFEQYCTAIQAAKQSIYLENQCLEIPEIIEAVHDALKRGVEVVALLPITPDLSSHAFLEARAGLGAYPNFTLAGMAGMGTDGYRKPVWVHSKLMLIDDKWATIGSANLHRWSMFGNAELNAVILSNETVKAFRVALLEEHLGLDTSDLDGVTALQVFKKIAHANQEKFSEGNQAWQGLVVALDVSSYGVRHPKGWEI